jgi:hypothetical protein
MPLKLTLQVQVVRHINSLGQRDPKHFLPQTLPRHNAI